MNKRWFPRKLIVVVFLIVLFSCGALSVFKVAPKIILAHSVSKTMEDIKACFANNPVPLLKEYFDSEGKYTAELRLEFYQEHMGKAECVATVQTNGKGNQISMNGVLLTEKECVDLSSYLDAKCIAVCSENVLGGNCYGLNFDSFIQDVKNIPFSNYFINEELLLNWNRSLQSIQTAVSSPMTFPEIPEVSDEEIEKLLLGLVMAPCQIEKRAIAIGERVTNCWVASYMFDTEAYDNLLLSDYGMIEAEFYMENLTLVKINLKRILNDKNIVYEVFFGNNPATNQIEIVKTGILGENAEQKTILLEAGRDDSNDFERCIISFDKNSQINFKWYPANKLLYIDLDDCSPIKVILQDDFCHLESENLEEVLHWIFPDAISNGSCYFKRGAIDVFKGSEIECPAYKGIKDWALEDLLIVLNGIGKFIEVPLGE